MKRLLIFSLILFGISASAETEFKIITLQHHFASDLLPIISPMVGDDGTATGINNQLILRASPDRMREIEQTISQLDIARVNRKITMKTTSNIQTEQTGIDATGNVKIGRVIIDNNRRMPTNTGRVEIEDNSHSSRQTSNQFINVLDGERAFIRVGQIVPFTEEWVAITRNYVQIERFTDWREISTGFAVRPRTIGNQVELEITPRIARPNNQGFIDFEELTTSIRTSLGSWVDIGSTMQTNDEVSRKILGRQQNSTQQSTGLTIRVD